MCEQFIFRHQPVLMFTRSIKKEQEPEMENYAETVRFHKIPTPGN